jgi:mono/diheme cytochrome c family protein
MSNDLKNSTQTATEPKSPVVPVWIFCLMLLLMFACGVYFDRHSGWFDDQVYAPFQNSDEVAAYQPVSGAAATMLEGQKVYSSICAACHGDSGQGKPGQAPPLAGSEWVDAADFKEAGEVPQLGLNGEVHVEGQDWNLQMAPMGAALSDSDLAAVLTYVRGSWGNKAADVSAADIKSMRAAISGHPAISGEAGLKAIK